MRLAVQHQQPRLDCLPRAHMGPRTPEVCLRIWGKNCARHSNSFVKDHLAECSGVVKHANEHCQWSTPSKGRDIRVIHFKGK